MSDLWNSLSNWWSGTPNYTISNYDKTGNSIDLSQFFTNGVYDSSLAGGLDLEGLVSSQLMAQGYQPGTTAWDNAMSQLTSADSTFGQNTGGITGLVDSFGGWGNVLQGVGQLGNLYMGISQLGLMQDSLDLANSQYNTSKALAQANLNNSVQAYNTSMSDRMRARAKAETGDSSSYNDQIEERKLSSVTL